MKKNYFLLTVCLLLTLSSFAQNIAINADGSLPNTNAILDIKSGNKGLLIPRLDSTARKAIPGTKGLLVYDTSTNSFWYNTGAQWQNIATGTALAVSSVADSAWLLKGNNNVHDTINFLGTINNVPLNIRVNNQPSGRIDANRANAFWGYQAGKVDTGSFNTALGAYSLQSNISGTRNTASGTWAMLYNTEGYNNTADGVYSMYYNTSGYSNAAVGLGSLNYNTSGYQNTAMGQNALRSNTTGTRNTAHGYEALFSNTATSDLTATGYQALYSNTTGTENVANGYQALYSNIDASDNTAVGYQAMYSTTASGRNTAIGYHAMFSNTLGGENTVQGYDALASNISGSENVAIGIGAMFTNTEGSSNTAVGLGALDDNTLGWHNTATGLFAMLHNTTGGYNVASGEMALSSNTFGYYNTAIGYFADVNNGELTNATAIGNGAVVDASNKVRIGNGAVTVIEGQVPFTTPSDGRYKFNVREDVKGLDFILHLRPVTYQFDVKRFDAQINHRATGEGRSVNYAMQTAYDEASRIRRSGFIAQEVEQTAKASSYDFSGIIRPATDQDHYSLSYDAFVVPLVKAVQEQQEIIRDLTGRLEQLEKELEKIKGRVAH